MTDIRATALSLWTSDPLISRAFADFQSFYENLVVARTGARRAASRVVEWLDGWREAGSEHRQHALARAGRADYPLTSIGRDIGAAQRQGGRLTLWIYGPIDETAATAIDALRAHHDATGVFVRIDSPGGDLDAGLDLFNALRVHRGRTLSIIDRACWSAATVVAVGCDRIVMRAGATMMLHRSRKAALGDEAALLEAARELRQADENLLRLFAGRQRLVSHNKLRDVFSREHFMSAQEAQALGFCDRVIPSLPPLDAPSRSPTPAT